MSNAAPEILSREDFEVEYDGDTFLMGHDAALRGRVRELEAAFLRSCSEVQRITEERDAQAALKQRNIDRWTDAQDRLATIEAALQRAAGISDRGSLDCIEELSRQVSALRAELETAKENFDSLKSEVINAAQCVGYYGDDTDSALTCFTSAIAQAEPRMLAAEEASSDLRVKLEAAESSSWIHDVLLDVAELPDRDSPEGWPEAMLVTAKELGAIIRCRIDAAMQPATKKCEHCNGDLYVNDDPRVWCTGCPEGRAESALWSGK